MADVCANNLTRDNRPPAGRTLPPAIPGLSPPAWDALCRPLLHQVARVEAVEEENYRTKTFTTDLHLPNARPGQFAMVWLPGLNERPFSLLSNEPVRFTVAAVGPFTRALHRLRPGDRLWVRGPLGNGFTLVGKHLLLIGGGYGVAPLYYLAQTALAAGRRVTVIVGARTRAEVLFERRFQALGVHLILTTDDGSYGEHGLVTAPLTRLLTGMEDRRPDHVYACGPAPMLEAIRHLCQVHGIPAQLSWEQIMRCGMGICGTCEREGWLVCHEGPVQHITGQGTGRVRG